MMRQPHFKRSLQQTVFDKGAAWMKEAEALYRGHALETGTVPGAKEIFQIRLFGANFAVSAMMLAEGSGKREDCEKVYLALLDLARRGLRLSEKEIRAVSVPLLREQSRALQSELANVGAGQYALAALYESLLGTFKMPKNLPSVLGAAVGGFLAHWAALYQEIKGKPMQTYAAGFQKSAGDMKRLGE